MLVTNWRLGKIAIKLINYGVFTKHADRHKKALGAVLREYLAEVVARRPNKTFIEIGGLSRTYQEFWDGVLKSAAMFSALGIEKGDRVACSCPIVSNMSILVWMSVIGGISVPVNTAYKRDEMAYILNNAEAKGLITDSSLSDVAGAAADLSPSVEIRLLRGIEGSVPEGWTNFALEHEDSVPLQELPDISPHDISMLVYTSGTTGNPKGVMCTHLMYVAAGQGFAHGLSYIGRPVLHLLPYYHANIQYYSTMGALAAGGTLVVVDRFSASRFWGQVREAQATVVNFIGMMMPVLSKNTPSVDDKDNTVRLFYGLPSFPQSFWRIPRTFRY
ncbi:MAG: hypothetical protein Ct9H300mP11_31050 [Chloroflexota bacterium]|nr:MAG: hypothetical protein Ct9H300mP11_31050 [Chloroflexota bacterium]